MGLVKSRNTNHNNQHLKLNILTFDHPEEEKEFGFVKEKKEGYAPLQRHEFPLELWSKHEEELQNTRYLYSDFKTKEEADYTTKVNLTESTNFAKHYYTHLIRTHFKSIADIITPDFIKNVVLWFEDKENSTEDNTHIIPYYGLKDHGTCKVIPFDHVRMFFICHEDDKDTANKLYTYFKEGFKNFPDLNKFMRIPLNIEKRDQITFKNKENPIPEIREVLANRTFNENTCYIAIYLSPYTKDEPDPEKRQYYYLVKKELLKYNITSHVIEKETVFDPQLNYSLPNIAVAILAKLDGIPWRLKRSVYSELIVGVGAFKPRSTENRYVGSAFCFSNDGRFQGFECYSANNTAMLAGSIRNAVKEYAVAHDKVKRLVIHFYKTMSREELNPILNELKDLGLDIPVIIITINKTESEDIVAFDTNWNELMPLSGTYINIGNNRYLLFNNTRYGDGKFSGNDGYPFPIKLSIDCTDKEQLKDIRVIRELIDQVYQFSRMYWKSVRQQNLPVTIKYPEMVAKIAPHFEGNDIPQFGKDNLWFL